MKVLVFGSHSLTAKHLPVMRHFLLAAVLYRFDDSMGPIPLEWIGEGLAGRVPDDARFMEGPFTLVHGDGPPGKQPGAIGADKLAEVAASLEWPTARRVRRFPPNPAPGEEWKTAAGRRNVEMVEFLASGRGPVHALCVHTDLDASRGSIITAEALTRLGIPYLYVRVSPAGEFLGVTKR